MLIGPPGRYVHAVANTWALMARAGAETQSEYRDWNIGNIMTLNGSDTQEVRLVDYAGTKELVLIRRPNDYHEAFSTSARLPPPSPLSDSREGFRTCPFSQSRRMALTFPRDFRP